jgi:hypothetical protein
MSEDRERGRREDRYLRTDNKNILALYSIFYILLVGQLIENGIQS